MMAEIVNLRRARKAKMRAKKEADAEAARVQSGAPKPARDLTKARTEKALRDLEGMRLDPDKDRKQ